MNLSQISDEKLFRESTKGNQEAYNHLIHRLLTYSVGITINVLNELSIKGYDLSEAQSIASQCILISLDKYDFQTPLRLYFRYIFLRDLFKSIESYLEDVSFRVGVELDEFCYEDERYSRHEYVGTAEEDPKENFELNELKIILNERKEGEPKFNRQQRKALLMKMKGYTVDEIAKSLRISSSQARRMLEKDDMGTPLQEIKIKLK